MTQIDRPDHDQRPTPGTQRVANLDAALQAAPDAQEAPDDEPAALVARPERMAFDLKAVEAGWSTFFLSDR